MHYLKSQVIVPDTSLTVHIVSGIEVSVHDKTVFAKNLDDFIKNFVEFHTNLMKLSVTKATST